MLTRSYLVVELLYCFASLLGRENLLHLPAFNPFINRYALNMSHSQMKLLTIQYFEKKKIQIIFLNMMCSVFHLKYIFYYKNHIRHQYLFFHLIYVNTIEYIKWWIFRKIKPKYMLQEQSQVNIWFRSSKLLCRSVRLWLRIRFPLNLTSKHQNENRLFICFVAIWN